MNYKYIKCKHALETSKVKIWKTNVPDGHKATDYEYSSMRTVIGGSIPRNPPARTFLLKVFKLLLYRIYLSIHTPTIYALVLPNTVLDLMEEELVPL